MSRVWSATAGPPGAPHVVLVHGSLDRSAGLLRLSRRLADRLRVTRYDRRGYGRSRAVDGPFDIDHQVADLAGVVDAAADAGSPVVAVGHSFGGNVALGLVDRHPGRLAGVVVYESPLSWMDWWPGDTAGGGAVAWGDDPESAAEQFMRRLIGDRRWERLPPSSRAARRAEGPAVVGELRALRASAAWAPERIDVPVLALHGELGAPHHRDAMRWLGDHLPDCTVREVAGARHFGPNTHPDDVADLVASLVERVSP